MITKVYTSIAMIIVSSLTPILLAAPIMAAPSADPAQAESASVQAQPATSVGQASGPISALVQIPARGSQWFKFKYHYDNSDKDNEPTQAVITLGTETPGAVGFEVWTLGRMRSPQQDDEDHDNDKVTPVGTGTPRTIDTVRGRDDDGNIDETRVLDPQTLVWAGSQEASDTFYVLVKNTSDAPVNYTISISGPDVSY
jgi:hypothetical protein